MGHLHNSYLEIAFRFGLVGLALVGALLWLLVHGVWRAYRHGVVPADEALFVGGAFGLTLVWSLFNFNVPQYDWRDYWVVVAGAAFGLHLMAVRRGAA